MDIREQIIKVAKTLLGTSYNKLDCNEFVRAVFRKLGVELGDPSSGNAKDLYNRGLAKKVDKSLSVNAIASMLNKGDLVFWASTKHPERWMNIHHVSIYDEDGYNYESSSSEGKVVRRKLWENSEWQIVLIADITSLLTGQTPVGGEDIMIKAGQKDKSAPGAVYLYQDACKRAGYDIGTWPDMVTGEANGKDGSNGPHMQSVTKKIQAKYGLPQTGEVDALTYGILASEISGDPGKIAALENEIRALTAVINTSKENARQIIDAAKKIAG